MNNPINIFGKTPRSMMAFVGWLGSTEEGFNIWKEKIIEINTRYRANAFFALIQEAHTFLSQPMQESDFMSPPKPWDTFNSLDEIEEWKNHQPLFKLVGDQPLFNGEWPLFKLVGDQPLFNGEWEKMAETTDLGFRIAGFGYIRNKTRNDFIKYCEDNGIELEFYAK